MSSLLISGYFGLSNGRRVSSENPNTKKTTSHVFYDTVIQTAGVDVAAEIRYWSPDPVLGDGTVVDLLGKVYAPPNATAWIDVIQLVAFPGDPSDPKYEDNVPERPFPTLFVLGHSAGQAETMDDNISLGYPVKVSEYVRDQSRSSQV
ncbi:hypothetical protein AURDEDRAFT_58629 [Auricularia subglabra TFB-10046 SS5]|nr:hypothetical protein AURDEDRAFT_58629 [Auricularia subglabra TFB-10046 SS5]